MALTLSLNGIKKYLTIWPSKASLSLKNTQTHIGIFWEKFFQVTSKFNFSHIREADTQSAMTVISGLRERQEGEGAQLFHVVNVIIIGSQHVRRLSWFGPARAARSEWRKWLQRCAGLARVTTVRDYTETRLLGPSDDSTWLYRDAPAWLEWRQWLQRCAGLARVTTVRDYTETRLLGPSDDSTWLYRDAPAWLEWRQWLQRCAGLAWVATATTEMCWLSPGDVGGTVAGSPATLLLIPL